MSEDINGFRTRRNGRINPGIIMFDCVTYELSGKLNRPATIVSDYDFDMDRHGYRFRVRVENPEFHEDTLSDSNEKVLAMYKLSLEMAEEFTQVLPLRNVKLWFNLTFTGGEFSFDVGIDHPSSGVYVVINLLRPDKMMLTQNGSVKFDDTPFPIEDSPLETFRQIVRMFPLIEAHNG